MTMYIIESRDSFDSSNVIFQTASPIAPFWKDTRLYAGALDVYIVGLHHWSDKYTRIETGTESYFFTQATPSGSSMDAHGRATHLLGEYGYERYAVYVNRDNAPYGLNISTYPESPDTWVTYTGVNNLPSDIEHPEYLEDPRFLVAIGENAATKVLVVEISADFSTRYAATWNSPLSSSAKVTDLESVRLL